MKKALNLIFFYLIFMLVGIIFGTFLYSCYESMQDFIAGNEIKFFQVPHLVTAAFHVTYFMLFIICPLISYYRIRHAAGFSQTITYIILSIVTWVLLFPCFYKLEDFCNSKINQKKSVTYLSKEYFREVDDKVYYFTDNFHWTHQDGISSPAVVIDLSDEGKVDFETIHEREDMPLKTKAKPYREIAVKNTLKSQGFSIPIDLFILKKVGRSALDNGLSAWLLFISFGMVLCSLYGLTSFFEWRLVNASVLYFLTGAILCINSMYYMPVFSGIKFKLCNNPLFNFLMRYIDEPLLFFINVLFTLLFLITGIIKFIVHVHGKKEK